MMASRKRAIEQHCRNCIADEYAPGTWRAHVGNCTALSCALWPFRPTPCLTPARQREAPGRPELDEKSLIPTATLPALSD